MSTASDWDAFATALGDETAVGGGSSNWWLAFSRHGRALALPTSRTTEPESVDFFMSSAIKWWWVQLSVWRQRLLPRSIPQMSLSAAQHRQLRRMLDGDDTALLTADDNINAIHFGTQGPLQKVMVLGSGSNGCLRIAKMALRATADQVVVSEASFLSALADYPSLDGHVPKVVGKGSTPSGRPYFVMDAMIGETANKCFSSLHEDLLRKICTAECSTGHWHECSQFSRVETRLPLLDAKGSRAGDIGILRSAWSSTCTALSGKTIPLCLNHGDFVAWNFIETDNGLVALDWEYAQRRANPLADYFHFHLIRAALDGSLRKPRFDRHRLLDGAKELACSIFGMEMDTAAAIVNPLLLAYLIDTVTFYAIESGGIERKDPVVDSYLDFIGALQ